MTDWNTHLKGEREDDEQETMPLLAKLIAWIIVILLSLLIVVPLLTLLAKGWVDLMRWIVAL